MLLQEQKVLLFTEFPERLEGIVKHKSDHYDPQYKDVLKFVKQTLSAGNLLLAPNLVNHLFEQIAALKQLSLIKY